MSDGDKGFSSNHLIHSSNRLDVLFLYNALSDDNFLNSLKSVCIVYKPNSYTLCCPSV